MKITVTFDSLDELYAHMNLNKGFEPIPDTLAQAEQPAQEAQEPQSVPEGFQPADNPPFEEKPAEEAAPAVTEDYRVDVRKFLAKLNKQTGKNTAKELIQQFGATKLTDVKLEDLPALMAKAEEAFNA